MSVEQLMILLDQMTPQDAVRAEEMLSAIADHNWDEANGLIIAWSMQDEPDWGEIPDPFDGGIQFDDLRAVFE